MSSTERADGRMDDRGYPSPADKDITIRTRCMQLRDAHVPLRAIAADLVQTYPHIFAKPPSPTSVAIWADQGAEEWERLFGAGTEQDALNAAKVRPRKIRRINRLMGALELAAQGYGDLDALAKQIKAQAILEQLEATLVGTNAPKVIELQTGAAPAVSPDVAARVEATVEPAALPRRRTS